MGTLTDKDLEQYLRGLGLTVEATQDSGLAPYIVVRDIFVPHGTLAGRKCDVALARCQSVPYMCPPAIHTRPALVAMDMASHLNPGQLARSGVAVLVSPIRPCAKPTADLGARSQRSHGGVRCTISCRRTS